MIEKLTKEQLSKALHKNLLLCSENEIRFVFATFGLTIKEGHCNEEHGGLDFEVHFRRTYIARIKTTASGMLYLQNEYVNFGNDSHSLMFGTVESLAETLVVFINMFFPNLLQQAGYEVKYDPEQSLFESMEEAQDYIQAVQDEAQAIIQQRHPDAVSAQDKINSAQ